MVANLVLFHVIHVYTFCNRISPMKKSCQDLEKNLGKIFSRSCNNLARNQAIQDFRMDLEQESCKIRKILASSKSWHGFGTDFLPTCQILKRLGKILQDIFDRGNLEYASS